MKLALLAAVALAGCDVTTGPAALARGGSPIAQSAYAVTFEAIYDQVPTIGWELRFGVDPPGTSCDAHTSRRSTYGSVVLALANLGDKPPVLPVQTIPLAAGPVAAMTTAMVGYYTDVDPAWTLAGGTLALTATSSDRLTGSISATAHRGGETVAIEGSFDAPLCEHVLDWFVVRDD